MCVIAVLQVQEGLDELLFNLLVLGSISNSDGRTWLATKTDYFIIECMPYMRAEKKFDGSSELNMVSYAFLVVIFVCI